MPAPVQLVAGLGGAIGCDYRSSRNYLIFVEYSGKISRLNLIRPLAAIVSSGTHLLNGTWSFDFDAGVQAPIGPTMDVFWEQHTAVVRTMNPLNSARIVNLGAVDFNSITQVELQQYLYTTTPIDGNNDATNQLVVGDVFAVKTTNGNYAKVKVLAYGYDIQLQWVTYQLGSAYTVLGTGYNQPEDIVVMNDEVTAYVTERTGNLLRVNLTNANRVNAVVVHGGMTAPQQIALDEAHNAAYVVEYANPGRLFRIDLGTGNATVVAANLNSAVGVLVASDLHYAYVTEQGTNSLTEIDLTTNLRSTVVAGLTSPFFLTWTDAGESGILVAERDPANRISLIDLRQTPAVKTVIGAVPVRPSSVAVVAGNRLLECSDAEIDEIDLTGSVFLPSGPMFLGIGHVPVDKIVHAGPVPAQGYADTTVDPSYFFQVKDAPFGSTLPLMINHDRARSLNALYYKVLVDGVEPRQSFSDYKWDNASSQFVLQTITPTVDGFYPVRQAGEIWYNYWLGYMLNSTVFPNGQHTIDVKIYLGTKVEIPLPGVTHSALVMIDNVWPSVSIDTIWHGNGVNPVGTCGIVNSGADGFTFHVTALDPDQHLLSWSLVALWGDNKSKAVASDNYNNHISPTRLWAGVSGNVPAALWMATDPSDPIYSHWCAHTFVLGVWDRTIDGWTNIHYAEYHKSITIMLPPGP